MTGGGARRSADPALLDRLMLRYEVEQFYSHEAELLDERRFAEWLELLADDVRYWMPLAYNRPYGEWDGEHSRAGRDLNWFDEGKFELVQRVKQIETGVHWAEEPVSRTTHLISNLTVAPDGDGEIEARMRFLVYRNRTETETDLFVGKRHDRLRRHPDGFRVARRAIYLDQNVLLAKNLTIFF